VNFTKIFLCFGFADVTQNVDMSSSKNLRLNKLLRLLFATPRPLLCDPLWGHDPPVGNHCFKACSNDLALTVSDFCTDVSVSGNLLVTIAALVYLKTAALGCVADNINVIVEVMQFW